MNPNLLIEASAGTGKTQALANRLIELLRAGVSPQEIVALTFSRAAAGEIFERFVTLLATSAEENPPDAALLRKVISTQHLSQIGTLDSFLMKIVRAFPLELGLVGELEMMDEYRAKEEQARISFSILRRTDAKTRKAFAEAFALAMNREDVRSFVETYRTFIFGWHERFAAQSAQEAWGDPRTIWGTTPSFASVTERELAAAADELATVEETDDFKKLVDWVRHFRGTFPTAGLAKKLVELGPEILSGATVEFDFGRGKNKHRVYGGEAASKIRTAMMCVYGYVVRRKLELARGIHTLLETFEKDYAARVRNTGKLVFGDVPRLITGLGANERLALEYRLDSRIRAWALDEFQDTSREQWKALGDLMDESKQSGGEKSVFIVGDCKQAIYGWRNGDVTIFEREKESGCYQLGELVKTYRSGPAVVEAVNRVFASGAVSSEFPAWKCPEHESARPELDGFVHAFDAPGSKMKDFIEPVANALRAVDPVGRGLAAAVLVRSNTFGAELAKGLKALGIEGVVWEGESAILDTPALAPFLDLVQLADHPGDEMAWRHFRLTPLAAALYPDGLPKAAAISREMSLAFTTQGLVRTLRNLRAKLPEDPEVAWNAFSEARFTDMLRAASEFELSAEPGTRLSDFASFLASKEKRNLAEPGKIKVMTIHRSKGLGFDYVVLPLYEHEGLNAEPKGPLIGEGWILPDPGSKVSPVVGGLDAAAALRKDRAEQEALCTYYVALTRAKRAMTIICHPPAKTEGKTRRFSDFVRTTIGTEPLGNPAWYAAVQKGTEGTEQKPDDAGWLARPVRGPRVRVTRRLPSQGFHDGQSAGSLFALHAAKRTAAEAGTAAHKVYESIAWIDPVSPKGEREASILASAWREAFVRPEDAVELWRERSFEVLKDGKWTSGQFDRVVFLGSGADRRAIIYDFKTNRRQRGESEADFNARMTAQYAGQLTAYRSAITSLTGIPADHVVSKLLLAATMGVVECGSASVPRSIP